MLSCAFKMFELRTIIMIILLSVTDQPHGLPGPADHHHPGRTGMFLLVLAVTFIAAKTINKNDFERFTDLDDVLVD